MKDKEKAAINQHEYQSLDPRSQQIRLLRIRQHAAPLLYCESTVFDLRDAPTYSALSYTWGPPTPTSDISVDGALFSVRNNLLRFLQAFAKEPSEYLWIDQICINQHNTLERNHQVGLMSRIYSQCASVIVWLSDPDGSYAEDAQNFNETKDIHALVPMLRNTYWRRLWIVQEVLLASHVRVFTDGNVWVSWEAMCNTLRPISIDYLNMRNAVPNAKSLLIRSCKHNALFPDLSWCVLNFSANDCENPRDKVYGLMGLVDEKRRLIADYHKSLYDVFLDAVTAVPPALHNEVAVLLGKMMEIPQKDVDSLRYFLAFTVPPQVHLTSESLPVWSPFVTSVCFEIELNPDWSYQHWINYYGEASTSSDELADQKKLTRSRANPRIKVDPLDRNDHSDNQSHFSLFRVDTTTSWLSTWDVPQMSPKQKRYLNLDLRFRHRKSSTRNIIMDYAWLPTWEKASGWIKHLNRRYLYAHRGRFPSDTASDPSESRNTSVVPPSPTIGTNSKTRAPASSTLLSAKDSILAEQHAFEARLRQMAAKDPAQELAPTVYRLPLPETSLVAEWQLFSEILTQVVWAAPRPTAEFVLFWSCTFSDTTFEYTKQPCMSSILRLDPPAMVAISKGYRRWLP